jgi:chromosome partitioning protein
MRVIAVTNQKGGSGKTTSAVNVAAALGETGKRVLVVDLDPQANASLWFGANDGGRALLEVLTEDRALGTVVRATAIPGVDIVPTSDWLIGVDKALASEVGAETILRRALSSLPQQWDLVLLDCPPSLGLLAISALAACQEVLVPVEMSAMALAGLAGLMKTMDRVRERLNPALRMAGVLACRVDGRTRLHQDILASLRERFGSDVFKTVIRENIRIKEAWSFAKPITSYDTRSSGAEDYRAVAAELVDREPKEQRQQVKKKKKRGGA